MLYWVWPNYYCLIIYLVFLFSSSVITVLMVVSWCYHPHTTTPYLGRVCFVLLYYSIMWCCVWLLFISYCLDIVLFLLYIITIIGSIYRRRRGSTLISLIRICHCCPNLCRKFTIVVLTLLLMMVSAGYNTTTVRAYCCCLYYCWSVVRCNDTNPFVDCISLYIRPPTILVLVVSYWPHPA
jgi:hypothetical protein